MDCAIILTEDKQLNGNVQRVLDNFKDCELSEIGALFEYKDLKLKNIPDPLSGLRKLAANREWRLEKYGAEMPDKQRQIVLNELSDIMDTINALEEQKYEVWGLIHSYLKQLPKGLNAAIITLPLSMNGKGIATIDMMSRRAVICINKEDK
ncbi:MAG: hypothetical protein WBK97_05715 [Bacteroidales bacterium]|jgi:hypothetical protein